MSKACVELFAGVAGGLLASESRGHKVVAVCEFNKPAVKVLKKRRPGLVFFKDVQTLTGAGIIKRCGPIHRLCGGSPCQDLSLAGKKAGFDKGVKSSLIWNQVRLLKELDAKEMFWENVVGALAPTQESGFKKFLGMLTEAGYGGAYCVLSSAHLGSNHVRPRVWLLAIKGELGFREVNVGKYPKQKFFPTPMHVDARAGRQPMPANLRRNTPPLACWLFPDLKKGMTMEEIRKVTGDLFINPDWIENMLGFKIGWTDLSKEDHELYEPLDVNGNYRYPNYHKRPPYSTEPPRLVLLDTPLKIERWARRMEQLGNCQHWQVAALADKILTQAIYGRKSLF